MISYELKKKSYRMQVNLLEHESAILEAYAYYCPGVEVEVFERYYTVDIDDIPKGLAQKIGEEIGKTPLGQYALRYPYGNNKVSIQIFHRK